MTGKIQRDMVRVTTDQALAFRLSRQRLAGSSTEAVDVVAGAAGGIQAQVAAASRLALGVRIADLAPGDVDTALEDSRTIVKAWSMRGAAHLLPARDLPNYLGALERPLALHEERWLSERGLDLDDCRRLLDEVESLLDTPKTRQELGASIRATLGNEYAELVEHSWGGMLKRACYEGRICFGPQRGQQVTFVRTRDWLGEFEIPPQDSALAWLLQHYLKSYAPATISDFAYWSGLPVAVVRPVLDSIPGRVVPVSVDGAEALALEEDAGDLLTGQKGPVRTNLLPNFDSYLMGHRDKSSLVGACHYKKVFRVAGWVSQVVLVGGRIAGTWEQTPKRGHLGVVVSLFEPQPDEVCARIEEEACVVAHFLGAPRAQVVYKT